MGSSLDLRKMSTKRQSRSKTDKESYVFPQSNPCPRDSDKLKAKSGVVGSSTQRDELVKYMSNVPGFLKRSDGGQNIQEKALNVGVLDWSRLEKWKNKQTHAPALASNFTSFNSSEESSSRAATTSSTIASGHKKFDDKKGLRSSNIKGSYKEDLHRSSKLSSQHVKRYQYSETETKTIGDEHKKTPWEFDSMVKTQSDMSIHKEMGNDYYKTTSIVGNSASKSRHHGVSLVPDENSKGRDVEAKKSMHGLQQHSLKKKERNLKYSSDMRLPSLKSKNEGVSFGSQKKMSSSSSEAKKKMDQPQETDIDVGHKQCHSMPPSNIVLLRPRKVLQSSSKDYFQLSESRTSSDEFFSESSLSDLSYVSLPAEVYSEDEYSEIPSSSVVSSVTEHASSSKTVLHSVHTDLDIGRSSVVTKKLACSNKMPSLQSEGTCIEKDVLGIKLRNQCPFNNMKEPQDHETTTTHCSNKIGRSFSFNERSTLPKLSSMYVSAKSGPVTSESSGCLDNANKDKVNGHKRTMSNPLLRLLDPILKHKASNINRSAEHIPTPKESKNSINLTTTNLHAEKSKESSVQALLQLTIKNGLPLFKFVLNGERKVFAASMKTLASPEKDDVGCYFTFYLVNEIKKKSGKWMSYWSKEKNCGYVYNIVGQMKISSSKITESRNQNSKRQCMVKECVLSGIETDQTDQGPPKFIKSRDLAAVVIEIPYENVSHEGLHSNNFLKNGCLKCLADERCFCCLPENDTSGSIIVILPGGVHSSPNNGEPSPLIHRWKAGGVCDCGGWDVGCKLLVLSNQNPNSIVPRSSKSYLERFQLFVQEGAEQNTPLFTLVPLNDGLYSVEFSSTINHLQAFFISVAVLSSQKLPSSLEMSIMQEEINKELSSKNNNELQEKAPINYNPIPPISPVDRV
ncbi:uncharacterized protein LOC133300891 [Gastrolobium bilobum]|uniref:uncharacterized protein LOC133300891 n=1 Tax=Gastrolobium bilobum TaxID=150636 RepID=UPI002AAF8DF5|nr:uncharacterized protein LOC133300891 [Gastrolobium bilobum]